VARGKSNGPGAAPGKGPGVGKGGIRKGVNTPAETPIDRRAAAVAFFSAAASSVEKESQTEVPNTGSQSAFRSAPTWEIGQTAEAIKKAGVSSASIPAGTALTCPCPYPLPPQSFTDILSFEKHLHTNKHISFRAKLEATVKCDLCDIVFQTVAQKESHLVSQDHVALKDWIKEAESFLDPAFSGSIVPKFVISPRVLKRQDQSPLALLARQIPSTESPSSPTKQD
jgi:hypothetical protein